MPIILTHVNKEAYLMVPTGPLFSYKKPDEPVFFGQALH